MTTLSNLYSLYKVDIGAAPNTGTGDNIRDAFNKYNNSIRSINDFLHDPTFNSNINATALTVTGSSTLNFLTANVGEFTTNLKVLSNTISTSPSTGALIVVGGIGIGNNLFVGFILIV